MKTRTRSIYLISKSSKKNNHFDYSLKLYLIIIITFGLLGILILQPGITGMVTLEPDEANYSLSIPALFENNSIEDSIEEPGFKIIQPIVNESLENPNKNLSNENPDVDSLPLENISSPSEELNINLNIPSIIPESAINQSIKDITIQALPINNYAPAINSLFNVSAEIEIGVDVTDTATISLVLANLTYPNGSTQLLNLTNHTEGYKSRYNHSFTIPARAAGFYNITFIANDTDNNYNTTTTNFTVDLNFTYLTSSSTYAGLGYASGAMTNLKMNETFLQLYDFTLNGSYVSKVLDAGFAVTWNNISWVSNTGDLPNWEANQQSQFSKGINMTGNILLYHFNNDPSYGENQNLVRDFSGKENNGTWNGGASNAEAKFGHSAGSFDGIDSYINAGNDSSLHLSNGFSISTWIKTDRNLSPLVNPGFETGDLTGWVTGGNQSWIISSPGL